MKAISLNYNGGLQPAFPPCGKSTSIAYGRPNPAPRYVLEWPLFQTNMEHSVMKPFILAAIIAGLLLTSSCGSDTSASANVVARVNGKDITSSQLDKQVQIQLNGGQ